MLKIIVENEPYCIDSDSHLYDTKAEFKICDDSCVTDYLNALVDAMVLETFSKDNVISGMKRYVEEYDELQDLLYGNSPENITKE